MNFYDENPNGKFDELVNYCPDQDMDPNLRITLLKYSIEFGALELAKQIVEATYRKWVQFDNKDYKYPTGKNEDFDWVSKWEPEFFQMCMTNLRKPFEHLDHEMISETLVSQTITLALYKLFMVSSEASRDIEWRKTHFQQIHISLPSIEKLSRGRWGKYVSLETAGAYAGITRQSR